MMLAMVLDRLDLLPFHLSKVLLLLMQEMLLLVNQLVLLLLLLRLLQQELLSLLQDHLLIQLLAVESVLRGRGDVLGPGGEGLPTQRGVVGRVGGS